MTAMAVRLVWSLAFGVFAGAMGLMLTWTVVTLFC